MTRKRIEGNWEEEEVEEVMVAEEKRGRLGR